MLYKKIIFFSKNVKFARFFLKFGKLHVMGVGGVVPLKPPKAIGLEEIDIWSMKLFFSKLW